MTISERLATNVKIYCTMQNKQIGDLERDIGVSTGYFSRVKGKNMMRIETGCKAAQWLGVSVDDLITGKAIKAQRIAELESELEQLKKEVVEIGV